MLQNHRKTDSHTRFPTCHKSNVLTKKKRILKKKMLKKEEEKENENLYNKKAPFQEGPNNLKKIYGRLP